MNEGRMQTMYRVVTSLSLLVMLGTVACGATQPPPELVDARKAYERASKG